MGDNIDAYRRIMIDHTHTYELWDTDLGLVEVCDCGSARRPIPPEDAGNPGALTAGQQ